MNKDKASISLNYDYGNTAKYRNINIMGKAINHSFKSNEIRQEIPDEIPKMEANNFFLTFDKDNNPVYEYGKDIDRNVEVKEKLLRDIEPIKEVWNHTSAWKHSHTSFDDYINGNNKAHIFDEAIFQLGDSTTNIQQQISLMSDKEKMKYFKENIEAYKVAYKKATGVEPHIAGVSGHADESSFHLHIITSNLYETKNGTPTFKNPINNRNVLMEMRHQLSLEMRQQLKINEPKLMTECEIYKPVDTTKMTPQEYQRYTDTLKTNRKNHVSQKQWKAKYGLENKIIFKKQELKMELDNKMVLVQKPIKQKMADLKFKERILNNIPTQKKDMYQKRQQYWNLDKELKAQRELKDKKMKELVDLQNDQPFHWKKKYELKQQELKSFTEKVRELEPQVDEAKQTFDDAVNVVSKSEAVLRQTDLAIDTDTEQIELGKEQLHDIVNQANHSIYLKQSVDSETPEPVFNEAIETLRSFDLDVDDESKNGVKEAELKEQELKQKQEELEALNFEPEIN